MAYLVFDVGNGRGRVLAGMTELLPRFSKLQTQSIHARVYVVYIHICTCICACLCVCTEACVLQIHIHTYV